MMPTVVVTARGAARWRGGHPWIYRSDVVPVRVPAGVVRVIDGRDRELGKALLSPASEIRLRRLTTDDRPVTPAWWQERVAAALQRREAVARDTTAYRVVHAEGDGLPSLVVDRYGDYAVAQLLSAGLEAERDHVIAAIVDVLCPRGLLLRHDTSVRRHERLPLEVVPVLGTVPEEIEVAEHGLRYLVRPHQGQKTGAFLDQRENRVRVGAVARGRALDVFCYEGLFALHAARGAPLVRAIDASAPALAAARRNADLNGITSVDWQEGNAFDLLRALERSGERFDTVVLDPPAFAKTKPAVPRALAGYKEINLRAMRLLTPGGLLFTASCSFHVRRSDFLGMLAAAAADSGRPIRLVETTGQGTDHPELLNVPETGYLKGALVQALD